MNFLLKTFQLIKHQAWTVDNFSSNFDFSFLFSILFWGDLQFLTYPIQQPQLFGQLEVPTIEWHGTTYSEGLATLLDAPWTLYSSEYNYYDYTLTLNIILRISTPILETRNEILHDPQLLTWRDNSRSDPTATIGCGVGGGARNRATRCLLLSFLLIQRWANILLDVPWTLCSQDSGVNWYLTYLLTHSLTLTAGLTGQASDLLQVSDSTKHMADLQFQGLSMLC